MDRAEIERRDFPVGRRGYDQAAVEEHLRRVADELERLRGRAPLSAGTSEQVRAILEAAERGAAELRDDAGRQAGEHVARVRAAAGGMLARIEELESELGSLVGALRDGAERVRSGLARLEAEVGEAGAPAPEPAPEPVTAPDPEPAAAPTVNGDEAGARLIALNMALGGTPREETAAYLAEHFALADADALLDDVYARAGG
jgi:DivIVA domain-containing protein